MVRSSHTAPPVKTVDEMSEQERHEWRDWLFAEGLNPVPIRQDVPPTVSSYGWDPILGVTVEHTAGHRYAVDLVEGNLTRIGELGQSGTPKPAMSFEVTELPRKRKLA